MFDLTKTMNGCLAGLVAITAGCGTLENWAAFAVGCIAGLIYLGGSDLLIRVKLDDAVDAIPVHMFNGACNINTVLFDHHRASWGYLTIVFCRQECGVLLPRDSLVRQVASRLRMGPMSTSVGSTKLAGVLWTLRS